MISSFYENKKEINKQLEAIYSQILPGNCKGCANCCSESVGVSFTEAANIYVYLLENSLFTPDLKKAIMVYYLDIYQKRNKCPFLDKTKRCKIYEVRPLNCRLYGHWLKDDYESNLKRLHKQALDISKEFNENGYEVSKEYLDFQIPYCHDFIGELYDLSFRNRLYDRLVNIDSGFIISNNLEIDYADKGIVEHIAGLLFDTEAIDKLRFENKLTDKLRRRLIKIAEHIIPKVYINK